MSLTGEPRTGDSSTSRRAVFLSTVIAALLVASALTFAIWMTAGQAPAQGRTTAAATSDRAPPAPLPPSMDLPGERVSRNALTADFEAKPSTTGVPQSPAPSVVNGSTSTATMVTGVNAATPRSRDVPTGGGTGAPGAKASGRRPASAASADLYKPF